MNHVVRALRARAYPVGMLLVGLAFIPLGILRYPAFLVAGLLYAFIGLKGLRQARSPQPTRTESDETQLERL